MQQKSECNVDFSKRLYFNGFIKSGKCRTKLFFIFCRSKTKSTSCSLCVTFFFVEFSHVGGLLDLSHRQERPNSIEKFNYIWQNVHFSHLPWLLNAVSFNTWYFLFVVRQIGVLAKWIDKFFDTNHKLISIGLKVVQAQWITIKLCKFCATEQRKPCIKMIIYSSELVEHNCICDRT